MARPAPSILFPIGLGILTLIAVFIFVSSNGSGSVRDIVAEESPTPEPLKSFTIQSEASITGDARFKETLRVEEPVLDVPDAQLELQWLRNSEPIPEATTAEYVLGVADMGQPISAQVTATKDGFEPLVTVSEATAPVDHVTPVRTTVKYQIARRGSVVTNMDEFSEGVASVLNDPRGWRSDGIEFIEVESGGPLTIYLSTADQLPSFASICSSYWSCRAGPNVAINETRWLESTPTWKEAKGTTLTAYRHMVVNHEVGHWLGRGHDYCRSKGEPAPLMMQQSKGLNGCKPNPWPLESEKNPPRFR